MSISGYGRRGFSAWDKRRGTLFSLHRSIRKSTYNQTAKVVWGDWFWPLAGAVVVPAAGGSLSFRHNVSKSKLVGETVTLYYNFIDQIPHGEVISSYVCTAEVYSGSDSTPNGIIYGEPVSSDYYVSQRVTLGLPGVIYNVTCTAYGEDSHVYKVSTRLAVLPNEGSFGQGTGLSIEGILTNTFAYTQYYETLDIVGGYPPFGPVTVYSGNYPIGWTPTIVDRFIVTSGIANDTGTFTFVYKLVDFAGNIAYSPQTVFIPPVDIYGTIPLIGQVGVPYSGHYDAQYGMPDYIFSVFSGTQISGVSLNSTTCYYTGTPTVAGTYTFETGVTDDINETDSISATVVIRAVKYPLLFTSIVAWYGTNAALIASDVPSPDLGFNEQVCAKAVGGYIGWYQSGGTVKINLINPVTCVFDAVTISGGTHGTAIDLSPDGVWAITADAVYGVSASVYVYKNIAGVFTLQSTTTTLNAGFGTVVSIQFSPQLDRYLLIYTSTTSNTITLVNTFSSLTGAVGLSTALSFGNGVGSGMSRWSPDGRFIANIFCQPTPSDGTLTVFSSTSMSTLSTTNAGSGNRLALCWHPTGQYVYCTGPYNAAGFGLWLYSVSIAGVISGGTAYLSGNIVSSLDISPDATYISASCFTGTHTYTLSIASNGTLTSSQDLGSQARSSTWVYYS